MSWALTALAVTVGLFLLIILGLLLFGRREGARALVGFVPDAAVMISRLVRDHRIPRSRAWILAGLAAYLASPIDLIPDFVPGLGHVDDVVVMAVALRLAVRDCNEEDLRGRWPGPDSSLRVMLRLAGASSQSCSTFATHPGVPPLDM